MKVAAGVAGWFNVKVHGVVGDGMHDDTTAIQATWSPALQRGVVYSWGTLISHYGTALVGLSA